jgi:hypothetical protein
MDQIPVVKAPMRVVPHKPFFPKGIVPDVLSMLRQKAVSVSRVRELQQPLLKLLQPQVNTLIPNLVFHQYSLILVCVSKQAKCGNMKYQKRILW